MDSAEGRQGFRTPSTSTHTPSTSSFFDGQALRLAVDPDLAPATEAWNIGLFLDPVPGVEGWLLVGALCSAPEDPGLSACLADLIELCFLFRYIFTLEIFAFHASAAIVQMHDMLTCLVLISFEDTFFKSVCTLLIQGKVL